MREHFLQQMRAHMVGGGAMLSPPDSPHVATNVHDDSGSSLEDSSRDVLHHHHQQQKLQYQYQHLQLVSTPRVICLVPRRLFFP